MFHYLWINCQYLSEIIIRRGNYKMSKNIKFQGKSENKNILKRFYYFDTVNNLLL